MSSLGEAIVPEYGTDVGSSYDVSDRNIDGKLEGKSMRVSL